MPLARALLVDDEPVLLDLMRRYVVRSGLEVDTAPSATAAWSLFSGAPARYALVITDLSLPDMSGEELLMKMLDADGALKGIVCTGHAYDADHLPAAAQARVTVVAKPFRPAALTDAIHLALGDR